VYQFIDNLKSDKAFFFYRGSISLFALLKAMDIQPGDEVILQVFTCDAVPGTIVRAGGQPVYVDIDPCTFNMDPAKIEDRITRRTKAILVQHTYGIPAKMDSIMEIARAHKLWVIEDSCHALGSRYRGQEVGTFGDGAFYSFGWHKPLVLGVGGAAIVNNPGLRHKMVNLYDRFGTPSHQELISLYTQYLAYSLFMTPKLFWSMRSVYRKLSGRGIIAGTSRRRKGARAQAMNATASPGDTMNAHLGKKIIPFQEGRLFRKLRSFERTVANQAWIVSEYERLFPQVGYPPLEMGDGFEPIFFKYPLLSASKKEIFEKAPQAGVELSYIFASPLYPHHPKMAARWRSFGYRQGMCPVSEDIADRIVALPVHTKIQARDIEKITAFLASFH
jgi:dTDP-4-amino-4,6-dideoxygalactose transaminase